MSESRSELIGVLSARSFWSGFLVQFEKTIHPARTYLPRREESLSAALSEVFSRLAEEAGDRLCGYQPTLEVPSPLPPKGPRRIGRAFRTDLVLFPAHDRIPIEAELVRIEVKWNEQKEVEISRGRKRGGIVPGRTALARATESAGSKPAFTLVALFHREWKEAPGTASLLEAWAPLKEPVVFRDTIKRGWRGFAVSGVENQFMTLAVLRHAAHHGSACDAGFPESTPLTP